MTRRTAAPLLAAVVWAGCEFADTRPGDASAVDLRLNDVRPIDTRPIDTRPIEMDARVDAMAVDPRPDASTVTMDVRADTAPAEAPPADSQPADSQPVDAQPVDAVAADPEPGKLSGMTRLHNQLRAQVSVPGLVWDPALAAIAQAYADGCRFQHSGRDGVGENLAANAPPGNTAAQAFQTWADEKPFYSYASNSCAAGKECGHYTQVVWRNTTRLGCGVTACTTGSPFSGFPRWELWVCNYAPAGNFTGQRPY